MSGRPEVLFPLFSAITALSGVGPRTASALENLGVARPRDLLFSLPGGVVDRRRRETVQGVPAGQVATVEVFVGKHQPPRTKGRPYRITVEDAQISFQVVFFRAQADYLARILPTGARRLLSGKIEYFDGIAQMAHPDHILDPDEVESIPAFEPQYPLTAGVTQKQMARAVAGTLELAPELPEWIDRSQMQKSGWRSWHAALLSAHRPEDPADLSVDSLSRQRLAYDELFAHQLTLALARRRARRGKGRSTQGDGRLRGGVLAALPFQPTHAQTRVVGEILDDMASQRRMNRLLQGDVGSGKTLVALMALLGAVEAGGQGVLMAPTEILAHQHLQGLRPLAEPQRVVVETLTGRDRQAERRRKLAALANGKIDILIGTHAVFQADVVFNDLRLAVIDEQHRFGVRQRLELGSKGPSTDVLVMTATPIPRSLALAQYGDMDVSILDEKPPGRTPVKTAMISMARLEEVIGHLQSAVREGRQCYWVCPLVEESEVVDLTAAEERFRLLRAVLGEGCVGLVHGQMPPADKDTAMARFAAGETSVLVATTVIEVGVDVPNASIMVIERSEIFGLAQLHQLRGRVGRGAAASSCLLLFQAPLSPSAERRLTALRETEDGFAIAETDLSMRGTGDLIGTAQSGLPKFKIADPERQTSLMAIAQSDARALIETDAGLTSERGQAARTLLWLMEQDKAIGLISVG
ncbi:MAG: ATP-dependent DNA helicase RecG [Pseudomonadota bacterium]